MDGMRYFEFDIDSHTVTEYERIGECNGCGACCRELVEFYVYTEIKKLFRDGIIEMALHITEIPANGPAYLSVGTGAFLGSLKSAEIPNIRRARCFRQITYVKYIQVNPYCRGRGLWLLPKHKLFPIVVIPFERSRHGPMMNSWRAN